MTYFPQGYPLWVVLYPPIPVDGQELELYSGLHPIFYTDLNRIEEATGIAVRRVVGWRDIGDELIPVTFPPRQRRESGYLTRLFDDPKAAREFAAARALRWPREIVESLTKGSGSPWMAPPEETHDPQ